MPYFADFGTFQCLILQISELFISLFYRVLIRNSQDFQYKIPKIFNYNGSFLLHFIHHNARGIASGSPVVATSSGLAIKSRESEAAMPYFAFFGFLLRR